MKPEVCLYSWRGGEGRGGEGELGRKTVGRMEDIAVDHFRINLKFDCCM